MGAAPDRGDTTTVTTGADTTQWDTTDTGGVGQTAEPGMIPDTAGTTGEPGTTQEYPTAPGADTSSTSVAPAAPGTPSDTSGVSQDGANADPGQSAWQGDSGATDQNVPTADSTEVGP